MSQDDEHLNVLSVLHYVLGGLTALFSCFPLVHLGLGIAVLCGALDERGSPPRIVGWFFILFAAAVIVAGWALAVLVIAAGRRLRRHVSHTFCVVVAALECIIMPLGTVLGVFTIIVLSRDSVKRLFSTNRPP